jgi:hypothetical protein
MLNADPISKDQRKEDDVSDSQRDVHVADQFCDNDGDEHRGVDKYDIRSEPA